MIDRPNAYKVFWSNFIALSILVFEFCYFYFYTHLLYKFTTFAWLRSFTYIRRRKNLKIEP